MGVTIFSNRELAAGIWLLALIIWAICASAEVRKSIGSLFKVFRSKPIWISLLILIVYVGAEIWLLRKANFWDQTLIKDTCIWFLFSAFAIFLKHIPDASSKGVLFNEILKETVSALEYICNNGGEILDAVATQVWSGDAVVHVSIVNWVKGTQKGLRKLARQLGDSKDGQWEIREVQKINSDLTSDVDVTVAHPLKCTQKPKTCFEGIQPGHDGFRLTKNEAISLIKRSDEIRQIIRPYVNGQELLSGLYFTQPRFILDFGEMNVHEASKFKGAFSHLEKTVLPDWKKNAEKERLKTGKSSGEHQSRLKTWWQFKRPRMEMQRAIGSLSRYISCARVTKRPVFVFLSSTILPDSSLVIFPFQDNYSLGILSSDIHWQWFMAKCSTLKGDPRYTSDTVFDTFPWPQNPKLSVVHEISSVMEQLDGERLKLVIKSGVSLRQIYRNLEIPGDDRLRELHSHLNKLVREAYGFGSNCDVLAELLGTE